MTSSPSDRSSPESAGSTSGSNAPVCALCGSASRTPSASGSLPGTGPESRVIPTCAPSWPTPRAGRAGRTALVYEGTVSGASHARKADGGHGDLEEEVAMVQQGKCPCRCHTSMSSAAASPAKTSHWPAAGPDWPANARVFGGSSQGSLGNYDPATSSLRTSQLSLLEDSTSSLAILPRAGSMRNGTIYQRQPLVPLTAGTASGLLPTPVGRDSGSTGPAEFDRNGLALRAWVKAWPTPTARLGAARGPQAKRYHDPARSNDLDDAVAASGTPGSLNPTFVEWLQGFPRNWTEV